MLTELLSLSEDTEGGEGVGTNWETEMEVCALPRVK